jgi:peptidoglycan-associated lipoprotein
LQLGDAFFDFDSAKLREDALATLTTNGRTLMENTDVSILVEGHCDERGTVDYNLALGDRRAASAKNFLVSYGIASHRIATVSYGESRPFATGNNEDAWAQNRRAHLVVQSP